MNRMWRVWTVWSKSLLSPTRTCDWFSSCLEIERSQVSGKHQPTTAKKSPLADSTFFPDRWQMATSDPEKRQLYPKLRVCFDTTLGSAVRFVHRMALRIPLSYLSSRSDKASHGEALKSHPRDQEHFFPQYVTPPVCGGGTQQGSHQHLARKLCGHLEVAVFGHHLTHTHMWAVPSSHFPLSEPPFLHLSSAVGRKRDLRGSLQLHRWMAPVWATHGTYRRQSHSVHIPGTKTTLDYYMSKKQMSTVFEPKSFGFTCYRAQSVPTQALKLTWGFIFCASGPWEKVPLISPRVLGLPQLREID